MPRVDDDLTQLLARAEHELRELRREVTRLPYADAERLLRELEHLSAESRAIAREARLMRGH